METTLAHVDVYTHGVRLYKVAPVLRPLLLDFTRQYLEWGLVRVNPRWEPKPRFKKVAQRVYASSNATKTEYRYVIPQWEAFKVYLKERGFSEKVLNVKRKGLYKPETIDVQMPSDWEPRDYQIPLIEYILAPGHLKIITLPTGRGKTSVALKAGSLNGGRILCMVLGRYLEKWKQDIKRNYGLKDEELLVVRGMPQLHRLIGKTLDGKCPEYKCIVISQNTWMSYIREYEKRNFRDWKIKMHPEDLCKVLKIGFMIIDEVHQHFHANFKVQMYTHCPKVVYLSATLDPGEKFMQQMYETAFPIHLRNDGGVKIRYIGAKSVHYRLNVDPMPAFKDAEDKYNHVVFENWLLRKPLILKRYLNYIAEQVQAHYYRSRIEGQRMVIFCAKVDFCEVVVEFLRKRYPILEIEKYTSEEDLSVIEEADISVTTIGSAGTALDIPDLVVVLMTVALASQQANLQARGRLRELFQYPDLVPLFLYFVADDVAKHVEYHHAKKKLFEHSVVFHHETHVKDEEVTHYA